MIPPPWSPKQLEHGGTISNVIDGVDGYTPDMLRGRSPEVDFIFKYSRLPVKRMPSRWPPPSGTRFVKIYGGELDGHCHPADGWYAPEVVAGQLQYLEWIVPQ